MKRLLSALIILVFCVGHSVQAQNQLTLEDAVMQQWRKFYPSDLNQFHWLDQNNYAIVEDNTLLIINGKDTNRISTEMLTSESLSRFPRIKWENNSQFSYRLPSDQKVYRYNIETKAKSNYDMGEGVENLNPSPNAQWISYTKGQNFYVFDTESNTHKTIAESTEEGISYGQVVHRYEFGVEQGSFWSPKNTYLAYYRNDERTVAQYPIVHTNHRIAEPELIRYPMAGEKSEEVTLEVYVVETGQTVRVYTTGDKEQYLTNIAFSPDEETLYIAILNRDQNKVELNAYETRSGRFLNTLFVESDEKFVQPLHAMQFIPKRPSEFLWRSKRDGFDHFYRYDTKGKLINQVSKGDFDVKSALGFVGSKFYYTAYQNQGMEEHLMMSSIFKTKSTKLTSDPGVHRIQLSKLGRVYDSYSNLETPRKVQLLDYKGKKIKDLHTAKNPYEQVVIAQTELNALILEDQTILNSRLIKPHDFDPKKHLESLKAKKHSNG
ncbi:MAG: DPP IV N-terminal domain-containing protein [Flavobacteriales bacterium]